MPSVNGAKSKPVAKMYTEMAKMIDSGFREGIV